MNNKLILAVTLSAFALAVSSAHAQTTAVTKPVGYHTITVESNPGFPVFNLTGANFAKKILAAGAIDAEAANSITDNDANFTTAFAGVPTFDRDFGGPDPATPNLVVEITSGPNAGINSEILSFTATTLTTMDNLVSLSDPGHTYIVREALAIKDIFGPNNEAALNPNSAGDKVWVPRGAAWDKVYYNPTATAFPPTTIGWKVIGQGNTNVANLPVYFTNGFIIERVLPPNLNIVITGHVRVDPAIVSIEFGFNALDRLFPVGANLDNCGLVPDNDNGTPGTPGDDVPIPGGGITYGGSGVADIVWMPKPGNAGWDKYHYNYPGTAFPPTTAGWKLVGGGNTDRGTVPLTPGIIVERKTGAMNVLLTPDPAIYSNL